MRDRIATALFPSDEIPGRHHGRLALLLAAPAHAIVGGGAPSAEGVGRAIVTIVGSRGNFCTGALIAPKLVLTVAHCVQPGATYKIVEYGADQTAAAAGCENRRHPPRLQYAGDAGPSRHRRCGAAAARSAAEGKKPGRTRRAADPDCRRQPLHHRRHRRHHPRRGHKRRHHSRRRPGRDRQARHPANPPGRSRWRRAPATGSAPAPGIPAARCSRTGRAAPASSASSAGRRARTAPRAAAA